MKLFYSQTSPYARQCRIALDLCSLLDRSELVLTDPLASEEHRKINPLGKVPALVDGERVLFDSPLVCEYINHLGQHARTSSVDLFPRDSVNYFNIRLEHVAANGILDAAVATVFEQRRKTEHSKYWLDRWHSAIHAAVSSRDIAHLGSMQSPSIASIAMACALAYLDFRMPELQWRDCNNALAVWFDEINDSEWMLNSKPQ